jgi:predicted DNA binding CopG/RHH family protein
MKSKKYIKSEKGYDKVEFDQKAVKKAQKKINRKMPTSVSLPLEVIEELKEVALDKGIPYQVLMRSFIIEGLKRLNKVA